VWVEEPRRLADALARARRHVCVPLRRVSLACGRLRIWIAHLQPVVRAGPDKRFAVLLSPRLEVVVRREVPAGQPFQFSTKAHGTLTLPFLRVNQPGPDLRRNYVASRLSFRSAQVIHGNQIHRHANAGIDRKAYDPSFCGICFRGESFVCLPEPVFH
jgi:hypothetical protein